ncbi:MAG: hypothetical protein HYW50_04280 [Candidatus Diapherotrites archaeon]|nr:hypothetical protein [Candidatus Diapherotrites archaeon]
MELKTKCLSCGYSLFFEKKAEEVDCPKCGKKWQVMKEDDEVFLEPKENLSTETVP